MSEAKKLINDFIKGYNKTKKINNFLGIVKTKKNKKRLNSIGGFLNIISKS